MMSAWDRGQRPRPSGVIRAESGFWGFVD